MTKSTYEHIKNYMFPTTREEFDSWVDDAMFQDLSAEQREELEQLALANLAENSRAITVVLHLKLQSAVEPLKQHLIPYPETNEHLVLKATAAAALYVIEGFPEAEDIIIEIVASERGQTLVQLHGLLADLKPPTPKVTTFLLGQVESWIAAGYPTWTYDAESALITLAHLFGSESPVGRLALALRKDIWLKKLSPKGYQRAFKRLSKRVQKELAE